MPVEIGTTISALDNLWPLGGDPILEGDNHLRLIKDVLKKQFPGAAGEGLAAVISATEAELNHLVGVTGSIQDQLDAITVGLNAKFPIGHLLFTVNVNNPSTYGYLGDWALIESGVSFNSAAGVSDPFIDVVQGDNDVLVPVPDHNHTASFEGSAMDDHEHSLRFLAFGSGTARDSPNATGTQYSTDGTVRTMSDGHIANPASAGTPSGSITVGSAGVESATINVQGKNYTLLCWKRIR